MRAPAKAGSAMEAAVVAKLDAVNTVPASAAETGEAPEDSETTEASTADVSGSAMSNPDDTNVWPTAAEEAAFLSEARGRGEVVTPVARAVAEEVADKAQPLPKLDELVERIPAETRELLDELFRAKFVAVRRVKERDLKK